MGDGEVTPWPPWLVQIGRRGEGEAVIVLGLGVRLGPQQVLAARGLWGDDAEGLVVAGPDGVFVHAAPRCAEVPPEGLPEGSTLGLLLTEPALREGVAAHVSQRALLSGEQVQVYLRPDSAKGAPGSPRPLRGQLKGQLHGAARGAANAPMSIYGAPELRRLAAGAPVSVDGQVVAFAPMEVGEGPLDAHKLNLLDQPWLLKELGYEAQAEARLQLGLDLRREVEATLGRVDTLRPALAAGLGLKPDDPEADRAEALAARLFRRPAQEVVKGLNHASVLVKQRGGSGAELRALSELLDRLLPYAVDWDFTILSARARALGSGQLGAAAPVAAPASGPASGPTSGPAEEHTLHVHHLSIAEALIAGLEGRACCFTYLGTAPNERRLGGVGFLLWPAADAAALRPSEANARESLEQELAFQGGLPADERVLGELAAALGVALGPDRASNERAVQAHLLDEHEESAILGAPKLRSLLIVDHLFDTPEDGLIAWRLARNTLGHPLPALRLVRLVGTKDSCRHEFDLEPKLKRLFSLKGTP